MGIGLLSGVSGSSGGYSFLTSLKTIRFEGSNDNNRKLQDSSFTETRSNGKTIFERECSACHSIGRNVDGPTMQDFIAARTNQWLFKYLTDRKSVANDPFERRLREAFNNVSCAEFPTLTKADVAALYYYISTH
jgi:hypothetical protein